MVMDILAEAINTRITGAEAEYAKCILLLSALCATIDEMDPDYCPLIGANLNDRARSLEAVARASEQWMAAYFPGAARWLRDRDLGSAIG